MVPGTRMMVSLAVFCLTGVCSLALTGLVRRYAVQRLLDVPNARSSHATPTPRGGGAAIVICTLVVVATASWNGWLSHGAALALGGGGVIVALVGWIDDHAPLSAAVRASAHLVAAVWVVTSGGGMPALEMGVVTLPLGAVGSVLAVIGVVWMTNLYNFMDGIDGLAGVETLIAGGVGGLLLCAAGQPGLAAIMVGLAGSSAGFLRWNWSPARIFLGDVGSGFIGFVVSSLAVLSERRHAVPLLVFAILFGVFILDATVTLLRRLGRGERWAEAHLSHAYQRSVQQGGGHARVACGVAVLDLVLAALAWMAWSRPVALLPSVAVATVMLAAVYRWVGHRAPMASLAPANPDG